MITSTFIFLDKVSYGTQDALWDQGIKDWNSFLDADAIEGIGQKRKIVHDLQIKQAKKALYDEDSTYLANMLPSKEHWRLYEYFRDACVFLDIEMSHVSGGYITCITLYDGYNEMTFVKGQNLDFKRIKDILSRYHMIITFNGNVFDLPYLKKQCPDLIPPVLCWDLRHSCSKLGLSGGLKQVERSLGIVRRSDIVDRLHGGDPLLLWKTYLATGDRYYLELLVEYNQEDTVNLQDVADTVYKKLCAL